MLGFSRDITVRAFRPADAEMVCEFANRFGLMTQRYAHPLTPDDLLRSITESGVLGCYIATFREERVIGIVDYAPACFGYACPAGGLQARTLFVDPQFRMGPTISELFAQGVQLCLNGGYRRVDTLTIGANVNALRLFRRAGFRQVSEPAVGAEEIVELINFGPLLIRYLYRALADGPGLRSLGRNGAPFDFSRAFPPVPRAAPPRDDVSWHGTQVVSYELNLPQRKRFSCLIDLAVEEVAAVSGSLGEFACVPEGARRVGPGRRVRFRCTYRNTTGGPVRLTVERSDGPADVLVKDEPVDDGNEWMGHFSTTAPAAGRLPVPVAAVVEVAEGPFAGRLRLSALTWVEAHDDATGAMRELAGAAGATVTEEPEAWCLSNRWVRARVDRATGHLTLAERGAGVELVHEGWPDVGPPYPPTHKRPVRRDLRFVGAGPSAGGVYLELVSGASAWWRRDPAAVERLVPGSAALGSLQVRRRYHLGGDQLLRIETTVERHADSDPTVTGELALRAHLWALRPDSSLTVSTAEGELTAPLVHQAFPFMVDGFDHLRTPHLPSAPGGYREPWSAVASGGLVAGAMWPGAGEVRFGLRWMPSLLYPLGDLAPGEQRALPPLHLCAAPGDHRFVAAAWAGLGGAQRAAPPASQTGRPETGDLGTAGAPVRLRLGEVIGRPGGAAVTGTIITAGAERTGRLELTVEGQTVRVAARAGPRTETEPFTLEVAGLAGPPSIRQGILTWREAIGTARWLLPMVVGGTGASVAITDGADGGWVVDGGTARASIDAGGAIKALDVAGRSLLGPEGAVLHVVTEGRRWLHEPGPEDAPWSDGLTAPIQVHRDDGWAGLVWRPADAAPAPSGLSFELSVLARPGWPLAVAEVRCTNRGDRAVTARLALTAQAEPEEGAALRYRQSDTDLELPVTDPGARQDRLPPGRRTAAGDGAGIVRVGEESLFVVCAEPGESRGWVDESRRWRLLVTTDRRIEPGHLAAAAFVLGRGGDLDTASLGPLASVPTSTGAG